MTHSRKHTDPSYSITVRLRLDNDTNALGQVTLAIAALGGNIGAIDIIDAEEDHLIRDISIDTSSHEHGDQITEHLKTIHGTEVVNISDRTFLMHLGGKLEIKGKIPLTNRDRLSRAYTPGVARICTAIQQDPSKAYKLTIKRNTVAVVSDGTAVLGLGDIGPEAAMPVMEGKGMLFKEFANVDAFPVCLATKDVDEIVKTVKNIAPGFGGINLEDISAPRCFEIERRLKDELDIPVFHDDQHGTAVVMTAGFINALKVVKKDAKALKVVVAGVGAAGTACTNMLLDLGVKNVIGCDRKGALDSSRKDLNDEKLKYLKKTNPNDEKGTAHDVLKGADVFIGLSAPNLIDVNDLKAMKPDPIVFAMSNPTPEIMPEIANPHVAVMATGRSDYPNQINNVLCFPGLFRGVLDCQATIINEEMKMAAAYAIAESVKSETPSPDYIIPSVFNKQVATKVAQAVEKAAISSGVAKRKKK
ncbi:MAG: NAD-dependent malic enzyme [Proteobacteria bacterium]|nr:NAD-dependent malic enzyme [Pseudomonadota bacterium]